MTAAMVPCLEVPCQGDLIVFDSPAPLRKVSLPVVHQEDLLEAVSTSPPISHVYPASSQEDTISHTSTQITETVHEKKSSSAILYEISELRQEIRQYREEHQRKFYSSNSYSENVLEEFRREICSISEGEEQLCIDEESSVSPADEDDDIAELDSIDALTSANQGPENREDDVLIDITLEEDPTLRSTLNFPVNKTPPISTISELDEDDNTESESEVVTEQKETAQKSSHDDQPHSTDVEPEEEIQTENFDISPMAFRYEDSNGRVFALDDEVEEWIDGPFDDPPQQKDQSSRTEPSGQQNETIQIDTMDDEDWIYESLNITEPCEKHATDDNSSNGNTIKEEKRSKPKKGVRFSMFENDEDELVTSLDFPNGDDDYSSSRANKISPAVKTKSLLKKGPCSGARVTFNVNMTVFSEEFPEGESVAMRAPPDLSKTPHGNSQVPPSNVMCFVNNDFIQSHWLDIMMNDPSFLNKRDQLPEINDNLPKFDECDLNGESTIEDEHLYEADPPKQNNTISESEENIPDNKTELDEIKIEEESKESEVNTIEYSQDDRMEHEDAVNKETKIEIPFTENDFMDHVRLSKQCQLSPEEFKDLSTQHRSNNEVRHSIEMSALRRSLIRGADIKKKTKDRPKSASIGEMSLAEKLRMLTLDCNDNTGNTDQEDKDELELFVQQNVPRIEKIKKRYSLTEEDPTYGFSRLPSVRGIRPKYGTTTEILKQLQNQIQPHPLASQVGPVSWPCLPEVHQQRTVPPKEVGNIPDVCKDRPTLSYPEIKLRPKRGREGLQKSIQFTTREERGTPEGASSSPKILMDGWAPCQDSYGAIKRNSLPNYISRSGYMYPPPNLQPVYETPAAYYQHQNGALRNHGVDMVYDMVPQNGMGRHSLHQSSAISRNNGAVYQNNAVLKNGAVHQGNILPRNNDAIHYTNPGLQNGASHPNNSILQNGSPYQGSTIPRNNGTIHQNHSALHNGAAHHMVPRSNTVHQNGQTHHNGSVHQNRPYNGAALQNGSTVPHNGYGPHPNGFGPPNNNTYGRIPPPYPYQKQPPTQQQNAKDPGLVYYTMSV